MAQNSMWLIFGHFSDRDNGIGTFVARFCGAGAEIRVIVHFRSIVPNSQLPPSLPYLIIGMLQSHQTLFSDNAIRTLGH